MLVLQSVLLFLAAFLGGMVVLAIRRPSQATFQRLLVFSGGYLFAITVLHLLPDLFALHSHAPTVGLYLLIGFFLQLLLELLSKGVEHGHLYDASSESTPHQLTPWSLLLSLCIHAFLDGVILSSPHACSSHTHTHTHGTGSLLLGVLLHKLPVAFALASVLSQVLSRRSTVIASLVLFALASPLGLWTSHYCSELHWLSAHGLIALFAIVGGSFLHIATTIFFESSPGHHLNIEKFIASLAGAGIAVVLEYLL